MASMVNSSREVEPTHLDPILGTGYSAFIRSSVVNVVIGIVPDLTALVHPSCPIQTVAGPWQWQGRWSSTG